MLMLIIVPEISINAENVNKPNTSKSYKQKFRNRND